MSGDELRIEFPAWSRLAPDADPNEYEVVWIRHHEGEEPRRYWILKADVERIRNLPPVDEALRQAAALRGLMEGGS